MIAAFVRIIGLIKTYSDKKENMGYEYTERVNRIVKEKGKLKRWHKLVTALACVVVFCTTYALILLAVTMERETFCGYTEHTHTDACYSQVLTCDLD